MNSAVQVDDLRFVYNAEPSWRSGSKQILHGTEYTTMENNNNFTTNPNKLEWDIDTKRPVLCDLQTRFAVEGEFQCKAAAENNWVACEPAESADVMVVPNWWGRCFIFLVPLPFKFLSTQI